MPRAEASVTGMYSVTVDEYVTGMYSVTVDEYVTGMCSIEVIYIDSPLAGMFMR